MSAQGRFDERVDRHYEPPPGGMHDLLEHLARKGVSLWADAGQLRYKAPRGALSQQETEQLRSAKERIVAFLEQCSRSNLGLAPLTHSQLAHWNFYRLAERPAIRQIACATRMHGRLDMDALRAALSEMLRRHTALRTRIVIKGGVPNQQILEAHQAALPVEDFAGTPANELTQHIADRIERHILEPVDVTRDSLFAARLLRLDDDDHVLILAMEHMISDMYSLNLLRRELLAAYSQAAQRRAFEFPDIGQQFTDYAVAQRNAQPAWASRHGRYWEKRLAGCSPLRFPQDASPIEHGQDCHVPVRLDRHVRQQLLEWCRVRHTTAVMAVCAVYVALVLRWCNASDAIIQYQSDGRMHPNVEHTIGYFASALYLRVGLSAGDSFIDLLRRVTQEYCAAFEHADASYMAAQVPRPDFTLGTQFNCVPSAPEADILVEQAPQAALVCSDVPFVHPLLKRVDVDIEPAIFLFDSETGIAGDVYFSPRRHSVRTMQRFADNLQLFIRALLERPQGRIDAIAMV